MAAQTLLINPRKRTVKSNPVKRKRKTLKRNPPKKGKKKMARRRKAKPARRRRTGIAGQKQILKTSVYVTAGMLGTFLIAQKFPKERKPLVGFVAALILSVLGRKIMGKTAVPLAIGSASAGLISLAQRMSQFAGVFSDCSVGQYGEYILPGGQVIYPHQIQEAMNQMALAESGGAFIPEYEGTGDYFQEPHRANVITRDMILE